MNVKKGCIKTFFAMTFGAKQFCVLGNNVTVPLIWYMSNRNGENVEYIFKL